MAAFSVVCGSSPRVRGTGLLPRTDVTIPRFIPACAGNRGRRLLYSSQLSVHPRVCGEQQNIAPASVAMPGSSPRVRGTVRYLFFATPPDRFIPACAGNSQSVSAAAAGLSVHPRVCGEQQLNRVLRETQTGSSPRVRGTGDTESPKPSMNRFIPACAGNSHTQRTGSRRRPVHPRVCGEQRRRRSFAAYAAGSSPRVRGTVTTPPGETEQRRFIPACAGNSVTKNGYQSKSSVHPRVCGEQDNQV